MGFPVVDLPSRILPVIQQFASLMGLPAEPADDGSYNFVFERSGTLSFTGAQDGAGVIIGLSRVPGSLTPQLLESFFGLAGIDPHTNSLLHAGLAPRGSLVLSVHIADGQLDLPLLEVLFEKMRDGFNKALG